MENTVIMKKELYSLDIIKSLIFWRDMYLDIHFEAEQENYFLTRISLYIRKAKKCTYFN